ncbi:N-acetylmuramoyl-L-alanine amidase, partial [Clostridium sp.]
ESLANRVRISEMVKADFFISIHQNSFTSASATGTEVFYDSYRPNLDDADVYNDAGVYKDKTPRNAAKVSKSLAEGFMSNVPNKLGLNNRGVKSSNFYVTRNTTMPSVLVECGFITNGNDIKVISSDDKQQEIANMLESQLNTFFRK